MKRLTLTQAFDALNEAIDDAETALLCLGKNTSAEVPLSPGGDVYLGYGKRDDEWGLYVVRSGADPKPLRSCAMSLRIAAADRLDALLDALVVKATQSEVEATAAAVKVRAFAVRVLAMVPERESKS